MKTNKINGFNQSGSHHDNNDGPDFSSFNGFLNSILAHHNPPHAPPPTHTPDPHALEFRSVDGSGNNLTTPADNAAGSNFTRIGPAHFAGNDGHTPIDNGINPRDVSNIVVGEGDAEVTNAQGLSDWMYAWGQFVDHDLDLMKSGTTPFNIKVPDGDPNFGDGAVIGVNRVAMAQGTGTDGQHPATAINKITGWLDASMIYGSDANTAAMLRTADGHMKTSAGDNLPIVQMPNPDPNGPPMIDAFLAGDVRAQENPSLTAVQTLFVREHNYQVDLLHQQHPTWTGDQLYQNARAIVSAEIEHITYDEFLPHLLGPNAISAYHGYNSNVDPTITEEFAGAAFRFGHSIVSPETAKLAENGQVVGPEQALKDVFFEPPTAFAANTGADGILRHLGADVSPELDARIVDDLRNFLNAPPAQMDLAAINIQRGHDLGLGTLNETRIALGLTPYSSIDDLTNDPETAAALKIAFKDNVDQIDLWTGGLSESHAPGAMVGETFQIIIAMQFEHLRGGDRLWYENQGFDAKTLNQINHTTLADIIERNTDTGHLQNDVFVYYDRHSGTKGGIDAENPDAPQLVIGSKGFDTLIGGPQGDMLVANTGGTQTMTGGSGPDQFIVNHNMNAKITDFKPGTDKIVFEDAGKLDFKDVHIKSDHGNAVVEANGNHIVLLGVNPYQLQAHDFIYHA